MRSSNTLSIGLSFLVVLIGGCVKKGTYEDLRRQFDEARSNATTLEAALAAEASKSRGHEATIARLEAELAELRTGLEAKADRIAGLEKEGEAARAELAGVLKDRAKMKQTADQLERALQALAARKAEGDRRLAEYRDLIHRFKDLIDAGTLRIRIVDGRMVVALASDVLFDSGSAQLGGDGERAITEVTAVLRSMPERRFQIEGHTDNVPIRTSRFRSNWELASGRALSVVRRMIADGMPADRLSAASYGEHRPIASNDDEGGRAQNRRIEIVLVPDLSSLPGFEELQRAASADRR